MHELVGARRPTVVRTRGYLNGALLTAHTAAAIDTRGATTMLAFGPGRRSQVRAVSAGTR